MSSICAVATQTRFLPIRQHFLEQMRVLLFLRGGINQARIRRRILRLEFLDRFKIGRVGDDFRKLLQLLQLIQFCFGFFFFSNSSAHNNSSPFGLTQKRTPEQKIDNDKLDRSRQLEATRSRESKNVEASDSVKQTRTRLKALRSSVANQSRRGRNYFQVPTLDREICDIR